MEQVYLINRTYIQNKRVITVGRSVRPKTVRFDYWKEVSLRVNRISIYEGGKVHYLVDRSP